MAEPLKIYSGEAAVVAPLAVRAPGVYSFPVELRGNALVSTIFVDSLAGATITAIWKDYNPLTSDLYTVHQHKPIVAGYNREFIAEATHGTSILELTVSGGSPNFGAFATANTLVGNFASPSSTQNVTGELEVATIVGTPIPLRTGVQDSEQNATKVLLTATVPGGKIWKFTNFNGQSRFLGYFEVWLDNATCIAKMNSGPASENPTFLFLPYDMATAGQVVEIRYTQGDDPIADVSAFLFVVETTP